MCVVARPADDDVGLGTGLGGGGVSVAGVSVAWYSERRRRLYAENSGWFGSRSERGRREKSD